MYQFPVLVGILLLPLLSPTLFSALLRMSLTLLIPERHCGMLGMMSVLTKDLWIPALLSCGMKIIQIAHELAQWGQEVITQYFCRDLVFVISSSSPTSALKASCRLPAQIRPSEILQQMRHTTTTLYMIPRCGKRYTQTRVSTSMCVEYPSIIAFTNLSCDQVAIAQNLGLLTLRLADSIILPLNTTQYALELDSYLDK